MRIRRSCSFFASSFASFATLRANPSLTQRRKGRKESAKHALNQLYMKMKIFNLLLVATVLTVSISAQLKQPTESAMDRFLRYAKIDTQSAEDKDTVPSTQKQFDLARLLEKELKALGAQNVRVSEFAIVYAMVPGNLPDNSKVP